MTHFELNHRALPSTLEIIREARGLIYGHKLRIFGLWFGVSIANQVAETVLQLEGDTGLSFLIKFSILMVLAMLSHSLVVGMAGNIALSKDPAEERELTLDSSRLLSLVGLSCLVCVILVTPVGLGAYFIEEGGGLAIVGTLTFAAGLYLLPFLWLGPMVIMERNSGPIETINLLHQGLEGSRLKIVGTILLASFIAAALSLTFIGILWAVPLLYMVVATIYKSVDLPKSKPSLEILPTIQIYTGTLVQ